MHDDSGALEAEEALAEVARIRSATRDGLLALKWITSALWGLLFLGAVLLWLAFDNDTLSMLYWYVAVPAAIVTTWKIERPLPQPSGNGPFASSFIAISAFMVIGAFGTWFFFDERLSALVWYSVLLAGFAAFAVIDRHYGIAAGIAVLWAWGALIWLSTTDSAEDNEMVLALFATAIGAGLLGAGFGRRMGRRI